MGALELLAVSLSAAAYAEVLVDLRRRRDDLDTAIRVIEEIAMLVEVAEMEAEDAATVQVSAPSEIESMSLAPYSAYKRPAEVTTSGLVRRTMTPEEEAEWTAAMAPKKEEPPAVEEQVEVPEPPHIHHWKCDPPVGNRVHQACLCGAEKDVPAVFQPWKNHRRTAAARAAFAEQSR